MKTHKTTFTVYPEDCNYMKVNDSSPMVHGGTMLLKMDMESRNTIGRDLSYLSVRLV